MTSLFWIILVGLFVSANAHAQPNPNVTARAIISNDRDSIDIPLQDNLIKLDGSLVDWDRLPKYVVRTGAATSPIDGEDSFFEFSVAADSEYFYIMMTTPDKILVAGEHGGGYWNEDSFEVYINVTGNPEAKEYDLGIVQLIYTPFDIGNTNADKITVTGLWSDTAITKAFIFKTNDGWGLEAAISWGPFNYHPQIGGEIGFNADLNGAIEPHGNRVVKLIWSDRDPTDISWYDPSVFGIGVFVPADRNVDNEHAN